MILSFANSFIDFAPIKSMLRIAISCKTPDSIEYISTMVHDAQSLQISSDNISKIDRTVFTYSVFLSENGEEVISDMNPQKLEIEELEKLLSFFEEY
jgi:hypothetical protein